MACKRSSVRLRYPPLQVSKGLQLYLEPFLFAILSIFLHALSLKLGAWSFNLSRCVGGDSASPFGRSILNMHQDWVFCFFGTVWVIECLNLFNRYN